MRRILTEEHEINYGIYSMITLSYDEAECSVSITKQNNAQPTFYLGREEMIALRRMLGYMLREDD